MKRLPIFGAVMIVRAFLALVSMLGLYSCTFISGKPYSDNYPEPCTAQWFNAIEQELKLVDKITQRPPPGSTEWLSAAEKRLSISKKTGYPVGDIEWCHQLHQYLIGL